MPAPSSRPALPTCAGPARQESNVALPREGRGREGRGAGPAAHTRRGPLLPGTASSARVGNYPPSGHPKFSRVLNFRRRCVDSCYTGPFPAHNPDPSHTLHPVQRRFLESSSPAPEPGASELMRRALPEVGRAARRCVHQIQGQGSGDSAHQPAKLYLPGGRSWGNKRGHGAGM